MSNSRRAVRDEFFIVLKARPGRYRACVDLLPGSNGLHRYCRDAATREEAEEQLRQLREKLVACQGPVMNVIDAWEREDG